MQQCIDEYSNNGGWLQPHPQGAPGDCPELQETFKGSNLGLRVLVLHTFIRSLRSSAVPVRPSAISSSMGVSQMPHRSSVVPGVMRSKTSMLLYSLPQGRLGHLYFCSTSLFLDSLCSMPGQLRDHQACVQTPTETRGATTAAQLL